MRTKMILAVATMTLVACGSEDTDPAAALMPPGGVLIAFSPTTDEAGACRPERRDLVDVGTTGLVAIRGETSFGMQDGQTRIPFRSVYGEPDAKGLADVVTVSTLNQKGDCANVRIRLTIQACEYQGAEGPEVRPCPTIASSGSSAFADIDVIREDR